jgi:ribose transport system substrate-binding protein
LSLAGLTLLLPVGCTSRKELPQGDGGTAAGDLTIGVIAKAQDNPVFQAALKGAEARAAALTKDGPGKVVFENRTPNGEDAQEQAQRIEQLVAGGASGIAIACSDASKVTRAINRAVEQGVPVLCWDSDALNSERIGYVGTDDREAGRMVAAELAKLLEGQTGQVAILRGNLNATNLQKRVDGAREELAKHENLTLLDENGFSHIETPQAAFSKVEEVQKANPQLIGWAMIGGWPLMTERAMPWDPAKVKCVSMDTLPGQLKHLRMGDVQVLFGQQYWEFGQKCIDLLVDYIRTGTEPDPEVQFLPLDRVTQENLDKYEARSKQWQA